MSSNANRTRFLTLALGALFIAALSACGMGPDSSSPSATSAADDESDGGLTLVEDGLDADTTEQLGAAASDAFGGVSAPGAVMAIRTPEGTWAATIGYQDWEETTPMAADVNQRVGSVTKTFTITALMQLAERGDLSLDDPIEKYVPGMPNGDATL